jgi:hypothetical protein
MRRLPPLLFAALLVGAPVLAQSAKGKKPKPPASTAPAKADEAPKAAAKACPECPACPEEDRALARALIVVFDPAPEEIRVLAVENLGLLGDPRALNVPAPLLLEPNPRISAAALRAIRAFQTPRAEEILQNVVRHPKMGEPAKAEALQALMFQRSATAREFLESVRDDRDGRFGAKLSTIARGVLQQWGELPRR